MEVQKAFRTPNSHIYSGDLIKYDLLSTEKGSIVFNTTHMDLV